MSFTAEELFPYDRPRWLARLHLIGFLGAAALVCLGLWRIPGLASGPLLLTLGAGLALQVALLAFLYRRKETGLTPRARATIIYAQLGLDLAGLTLLLHFSGGSENPFFPFYVFPVILAGALLTRGSALGFAGTASLLYGLIIAGEALGWLPHYPLGDLHDPNMYRVGTYLVGQVLALTGTCFLAGAATAVLMDALRARARELAEAHRRVETRAGQLRQLNEQLRAANEECRHSREHLDDLYIELQQAYTRLEVRTRNMSELNEQLRAANAECKGRREELGTVYEQVQDAYRRLETRSEHMRELNEQLRAANAECSRQRQELSVLNERLIESNAKLSALEDARAQFTLLVTHELRAPVAAIQSYLKLILDGYVKPEKMQETLEKAEKRAIEQLVLIGDLLELGRVQSADARGKLEPVHVERALLDQVDFIAPRAQENGVTVNADVEHDLPPVLANQDQIRSVWNNLISNAIKYNRQGGQVSIALRCEGDRLVGIVSDSGIGIPAEAMSRLFSEFFRAENAKAATRMGTGLGLAIVKEIVEHAGGQITCESELDKGTTFRFWLPTMKPEAPGTVTTG